MNWRKNDILQTDTRDCKSHMLISGRYLGFNSCLFSAFANKSHVIYVLMLVTHVHVRTEALDFVGGFKVSKPNCKSSIKFVCKNMPFSDVLLVVLFDYNDTTLNSKLINKPTGAFSKNAHNGW